MQAYKTLQDFLKILLLFKDTNAESLGVSEISKALRMSPSKASRMLATLEREGAFEKRENNGKYRLGILFLELGLAFVSHFDLHKIIRPHLEQMAKERNITASFSIRRNERVITIDRIQNLNIDLMMAHRIGFNVPVHSTSPGKILLAYLPDEQQDEILRKVDFKKFTSQTITDPRLFKENLKLVRERGYAADQRETHEDLNCISAPVRNSDGQVVCALNLMGERSRMNEEELFQCIDYLKGKALFISRQLGYRYGGTGG
jgi:IclR family KDG regulon transcriptional repressor